MEMLVRAQYGDKLPAYDNTFTDKKAVIEKYRQTRV